MRILNVFIRFIAEEFIIVFKNFKMKFHNHKYLLCKMIKINFN